MNLRNQLEFPAGKVLYETAGWISHPRVSPDGTVVAFLDHPQRGDDGGSVAVVDRSGKKTSLAGAFSSEYGLAWSPNGKEIWVTGAKVGGNRAIHAFLLNGGERLLARVTQSLTLQDVSRDGRVLVAHDSIRIGILAGREGQAKEKELTWLDWSSLFDLSDDGKTILFSETGEGCGPAYSTFIRSTDGAPAVRLGEGGGQALSPDGQWAAVQVGREKRTITLYPTGAGEKRVLPTGDLETQGGGSFTPDGKSLVFTANEPGRGPRIWVAPIEGGKPRALTPEGYRSFSGGVARDGERVLVVGPDRKRYFYPMAGGEPVTVPGLGRRRVARRLGSGRQSLYVFRRRDLPGRVYRLDLGSGKKELLREVMPADGSGIVDIAPIIVTPDGAGYVYSFQRMLSDLYLVEGLK